MREKIELVIAALNQLEIRGEKNLDILLGCIQMLRRALEELNDDRQPHP